MKKKVKKMAMGGLGSALASRMNRPGLMGAGVNRPAGTLQAPAVATPAQMGAKPGVMPLARPAGIPAPTRQDNVYSGGSQPAMGAAPSLPGATGTSSLGLGAPAFGPSGGLAGGLAGGMTPANTTQYSGPPAPAAWAMKKGGSVKKYSIDGIAQRGKTRAKLK